MKMLSDQSYGVVEFNILGDTKAVISAAIQLAFQEHKTFTHYRIIETDGGNELHLCWSGSSKVQELPFSLQTVEATVLFITCWVAEKGKFNKNTYYGGDGTNNKGVRLTSESHEDYTHRTDYMAMRVIPEFVYYGK